MEMKTMQRKLRGNRLEHLLLLIVVSLTLAASPSHAKSISCSTFGFGCTAQELKEKAQEQKEKAQKKEDEALALCIALANEAYSEGLREAIKDPSVWRYERSPEAYAAMKQRVTWRLCVGSSPELKD